MVTRPWTRVVLIRVLHASPREKDLAMDREVLLRRARAQLTLLRVRAGGVCQAVIVPGGPL